MARQLDETPEGVLAFWFSEWVRPQWFKATRALDEEIRTRFLQLWRAAADGELRSWATSPRGLLALVLVLDQFPLNMFRDRAESFSTEADAREFSHRAVELGWDGELSAEEKAFLYLPFMHSESLPDQERSVMLYQRAGLEEGLKWARHHRELVRRFGRFPHRNKALGRDTTPEEEVYLQSEDAFHG